MEHTKEPWKYGKELSANAGEWLISFDAVERGRGIEIAETRPATGRERENARRIVACVNALAHVSTEELESGTLQNFVVKLRDTERQRDELLAALVSCEAALRLVERETGKGYAATINARAAIAKMKGWT